MIEGMLGRYVGSSFPPKIAPARGVLRGVKVRGGGISPLIRLDEGLGISWLESASRTGLEATRSIPGGQDSIDLGVGGVYLTTSQLAYPQNT